MRNSRVNNFVVDRTHDYIMYDTTDLVRAIDFPCQVAGLSLKADEFHLSLFAVREEYGLDEAGHGRLEQVSCQAGAVMTTEPELTGDFLKLKDDTTDCETIIALTRWDELETWRDAIRELIPRAEFIIPHITLYTNQKGALGYSDRHRDRVRALDDAAVMALRNILLRSRVWLTNNKNGLILQKVWHEKRATLCKNILVKNQILNSKRMIQL